MQPSKVRKRQSTKIHKPKNRPHQRAGINFECVCGKLIDPYKYLLWSALVKIVIKSRLAVITAQSKKHPGSREKRQSSFGISHSSLSLSCICIFPLKDRQEKWVRCISWSCTLAAIMMPALCFSPFFLHAHF